MNDAMMKWAYNDAAITKWARDRDAMMQGLSVASIPRLSDATDQSSVGV